MTTKAKSLPQPRHPGTILYEDFLHPSGLSAREVAKSMKCPVTRISELIRGRRGITAETAILLERRFGNEASWWMDRQRDWDLRQALDREKKAALALAAAKAAREAPAPGAETPAPVRSRRHRSP